jgi:hypothetical protein
MASTLNFTKENLDAVLPPSCNASGVCRWRRKVKRERLAIVLSGRVAPTGCEAVLAAQKNELVS